MLSFFLSLPICKNFNYINQRRESQDFFRNSDASDANDASFMGAKTFVTCVICVITKQFRFRLGISGTVNGTMDMVRYDCRCKNQCYKGD